MEASEICLQLIKGYEKLRLKSYPCPAGVWTIGYGTTRYENGNPVQPHETITLERAIELLMIEVHRCEFYANKNILVPLMQHQFDAIISFIQNVGIAGFLKSTLYKKILRNPFDPRIPEYFARYKFGGDGTKNKIDDDGDGLIDEEGERQRLAGLIRRRKSEAHLYTTGELNFFET